MEPLKTGDPSIIAGFRLLGRLGAGGMGVVHLARSGRGALVALKVIRAERTADPSFRARFRREADIARKITGPWVVRVVDADPEAREPWLATEFVPGPSLTEAVAAHGPLPEHTVRTLGIRLAEALSGAHDAGLVHRDVKPGNVLLALDGPRLIDFGIARSAGATALTATDAMIGSPGYLSPEQARLAGAGQIGPPSDVFSLGCVLAYASTGRRPFGTGGVPAIVFRTVHEEPDLDGMPPGLLAPVRACLAKDPAGRPSAAGLAAALADPRTGGTPMGSRAGGPPIGARPGGSGPADWLPAGLPALIAERSARVLELPVPEPTMVTAPAQASDPAWGKTSRRRFLALGSAAAVTAAGGAAAWLAEGPDGETDDSDTVRGPGTRHVIGLQADLSGPRATDGKAQERGARLAVELFNAAPDRPFNLSLKVLDDRGDRTQALATAAAHIEDPSVVAVLGPVTGDIARAVVRSHSEARLPLLSVSADAATNLGAADRRSYFELRAPDNVLITPVNWYFGTRRTRRVALVEDRAGGDLSWRVARTLREGPPAGLGKIAHHPVEAGRRDFAPVAARVLAGRPDGVIYAGNSPARAALLARALHDRGFTGLRGALEPVLQPEFLTRAGRAADGWVFGTSYADPALLPRAKAFALAYRKRWRTREAERYAAEAYDAVFHLADAIRALGADRVSRPALTRRLRSARYDGLTKPVVFRAATERYDESKGGMFVHRVEQGRPRFLGPYKDVHATS